MPKILCPGNVAKLHMSEGHATFDKVRDECSRTIPAKNVRKYNVEERRSNVEDSRLNIKD